MIMCVAYPFVEPEIDILSILAVDLGGSHLSCGIVEQRRVLAERTFSVAALSAREVLIALEGMLCECLDEAGITASSAQGIAIGYPGIVCSSTNEILSPLNKYFDMSGEALTAWARCSFDLPLRLENDARLALLGEVWAGAAQGADDVVMVTLGTGIGGAAMIGGRLLGSKAGHAGSLGGHIPVRMDGRRCACGAIGCAEAEASTSTLPDLCRDWPGFATSSLSKKEPINFQALFSAVDARDAIAEQVLAYCLQIWSVLTVALIHAYGPELVIFGGGAMHRGEEILPPIRSYVEEHMWRTSRGLPRIEAAKLGPRAALLGAASLFREGSAFV